MPAPDFAAPSAYTLPDSATPFACTLPDLATPFAYTLPDLATLVAFLLPDFAILVASTLSNLSTPHPQLIPSPQRGGGSGRGGPFANSETPGTKTSSSTLTRLGRGRPFDNAGPNNHLPSPHPSSRLDGRHSATGHYPPTRIPGVHGPPFRHRSTQKRGWGATDRLQPRNATTWFGFRLSGYPTMSWLRNNLPGKALVHSFSSKVTAPLTRIWRMPVGFCVRRHSPPGKSLA